MVSIFNEPGFSLFSSSIISNKFGSIFIVCATGKSAEELLSNLKARLNNAKDEEIQNAASEQNKITKLRLEKLFLNN